MDIIDKNPEKGEVNRSPTAMNPVGFHKGWVVKDRKEGRSLSGSLLITSSGLIF
jgi:hypothetical protein